jgi:hypothetical protein
MTITSPKYKIESIILKFYKRPFTLNFEILKSLQHKNSEKLLKKVGNGYNFG